MKPLLSAALIVRDESAFLPGCLESLSGIVDEIVVVDTGSVDGTPEIARRFGATIVHHPWRNDFSEARNVSLDLAGGEWILYIDADERLVDTDRAQVEKLLRNAEEVAFRLLFQPSLNATPYREYRLWRHDPRIRFDGIIHEKVVPAIHRVAVQDGRPISNSDLMLVHLGYEGDQERKHRRNLPLLVQQLQVEPTNLFARHHLARVLEADGELERSEEVLLEATELARSQAPMSPLACLLYADLVRLRDLRGADTQALLEEALLAFPENCVLLWIQAQHLISRAEYPQAIEALDYILNVDWEHQPDSGPSYDERLVWELPWSSKALCLFRIGAYDEAAEAYAALAERLPADPSYSVKAQLALARARVSRDSLPHPSTATPPVSMLPN
jgi:tetratricopeptide (TPR) repeat protein